ncbi:MAG: DUF6390 family protein [Acidimicrobiia bacterium]
MSALDGPTRFARFAYPPNALGYCGPDDHLALLEYGASGASDGGLRDLARRFEGAWPYLQLIAGCSGIDDPLDARVVEAYWIGNELLDTVTDFELGTSLTDRFRGPAGATFERLAAAIGAGGRPHHCFHVFAVYPFTGLVRSGTVDQPLHVLERCRIRWGRVVDVVGGDVLVRSRPLVWDGTRLGLGAARVEQAVAGHTGRVFEPALRRDDWVALHWDWVCERLDRRQLANLRGITERQLATVNGMPLPPPAHVLA